MPDDKGTDLQPEASEEREEGGALPFLRRKLKGTERENRDLRKKIEAMEQRLEAVTLRALQGGERETPSIDDVAREDPAKAIALLRRQIEEMDRRYQNETMVRGQAEKIRSGQQESFMRAARDYKELMDPNSDFFRMYHEAWEDARQTANETGYSIALDETGPEQLAGMVEGEIARQKRIATERSTAKTAEKKSVPPPGLEGAGSAPVEDAQKLEEARKTFRTSQNETEREAARQVLLSRMVPERLKGK